MQCTGYMAKIRGGESVINVHICSGAFVVEYITSVKSMDQALVKQQIGELVTGPVQ